MLITLEGIDGSGKGSAIEALKEELEDDDKVIFTHEPSPLWTGEQVRKAINTDDTHPMADYHLFIADRAEHLQQIIGPAMNQGKIVISDRYKDSTRAYQRDIIEPYVHGMSADEYIENNMAWAPDPQFTILLDVDADTSVERTGVRDKYEKKEFLENTRQNYLDVIERAKKGGRNVKVVDATQPEERVVDIVVGDVLDFINERTIRQ